MRTTRHQRSRIQTFRRQRQPSGKDCRLGGDGNKEGNHRHPRLATTTAARRACNKSRPTRGARPTHSTRTLAGTTHPPIPEPAPNTTRAANILAAKRHSTKHARRSLNRPLSTFRGNGGTCGTWCSRRGEETCDFTAARAPSRQPSAAR